MNQRSEFRVFSFDGKAGLKITIHGHGDFLQIGHQILKPTGFNGFLPVTQRTFRVGMDLDE